MKRKPVDGVLRRKCEETRVAYSGHQTGRQPDQAVIPFVRAGIAAGKTQAEESEEGEGESSEA